jgi:hypothetical protein
MPRAEGSSVSYPRRRGTACTSCHCRRGRERCAECPWCR